jgi:hypothetical protein
MGTYDTIIFTNVQQAKDVLSRIYVKSQGGEKKNESIYYG